MQGEGWDREVDLVVAGAGPGGMTAALVAALDGLEVVLCEKSEQVGESVPYLWRLLQRTHVCLYRLEMTF